MFRNTIRLIVCFALALAIVSGFAWVMFKSTRPLDLGHSLAAKATDMMQLNTPSETRISNPQQQTESDEPGKIYKCGPAKKPTYSDKKCPDTERSAIVDTRETSGGFISPNPQAIADTRAKTEDDMQQPGAVAMTSETTSTSGQGCSYLSAELIVIDATARHALSGYVQEQLRLRREEIRTRQFRLGC